MDEFAKVKPDTMGFDELMLSIRNGKIRIPDFQREFVWDLNQIIRLLDSIYQHFPIGSFLFWETDDEIQAYRRVGEVELRHDKAKGIQYVLDGQQRLTSLFASLEQASIAHRINGKKVTKSIKIYFDLDQGQFVSNPFDRREAKSVSKRVTFVSIPGNDMYSGFFDQFLHYVESESPTRKESHEWLVQWPEMAASRARRIHAQSRDMGLFEEVDSHCQVTDLGRTLMEEWSVMSLVELLHESIDYFDTLLPKVLEDGQAELFGMSDFLSGSVGEQIKPYKVKSRLRWLAGLGLGSFDDINFALNKRGHETLEGFFRAIEIRERDKQERDEEKKKRYFSVQQITDLDKFVETAASLDSPRRTELQKVLKRFNSYPFSVIQVLEQPIETACEIFERINNSGKILNVVDLMVAKSWSQTFNLRERLSEYREELKKENYDSIPDITIIQCLSAIVQRGIRRKEILGIERSAVEGNWDVTLENVRKAIDFLKSNLNITHAKILPYNTCILPLAFYFSVVNPKTHDNQRRKELERWFWRASISNRYDQAVETSIADDIADMANLAAGKSAPFNYVAPAISAERIASQRLNLGSAFCKTLLCVFYQRGPRDFKDSEPVRLKSFSKFNSAELHHVFPKAYLKRHDKDNYPERDSIANIALARASANKEYSSKAPSKYLAKCRNDILDTVLKSHLVNDQAESGVLEDDFQTFIEYRSEQILQEIRRLTGEMTEIEVDVAESELGAVERFELRLRDLVHDRISTSNPAYWESAAPPDLRAKLEGRIAGWIKATPGRSRQGVREVDFLQTFEYFKVIKSNWSIFEKIFHSRSDLEQYFKVISEFRNALAHNREVDTVTRQLAIGVLAWFDKAFAAANQQSQ